eukprot:scaffold4321_cov131-Skeletonema_marinoi.AAC.2
MNHQGGGGRHFNNRHQNHRGRGGRGRGGRGRGRGGRGHRNNNNNYHGGQAFANHPNDNYNGWGNGDAFHMIESSGSPSDTAFTVAVQGCSHGELDSIYDALEAYRVGKLGNNDETNNHSASIDVLLCCGDVQTLRNTEDFHSLNVPQKYKRIGDFHAYYSGQKVAPILTIMVGGNHEASNYLQELHYGGWVAPNIYYLGAAGVINICKRTSSHSVSSLRIGGVSGIYSPHHYKLGRFEVAPYGQSELRSVYHTREVEVKRLEALASMNERPIDVFISHDWPRGIYHHGNVNQLLKKKPFFQKEVQDNSLGSPANEQLLHLLKPRYWFSAHLHVKFSAEIRHRSSEGPQNDSDDATKRSALKSGDGAAQEQNTAATEFHGMESNDGNCPDSNPNVQSLTEQMTRFLSLDKCLPKRRHIQIMHVEPSMTTRSSTESPSAGVENTPWLEYDTQWLSVLSQTHEWTQRTRSPVNLANGNASVTKEQIHHLEESLKARSKERDEVNPLAIPRNFSMTVRPYDSSSPRQSYNAPSQIGNPQTDAFLSMLGLSHRITVPYNRDNTHDESNLKQSLPTSIRPSQVSVNKQRAANDDNEIDLDDDDDDADEPKTASENLVDPCEIEIESEEDNCEDDVCFVPKRPKL